MTGPATGPAGEGEGNRWVVVLAGGRGARFWPLSRLTRPKQCLALTGDETLLQATLRRAAALAPPERTLVITGPEMADAVRAQAGLPEGHVIVEPRARNTAPGVGLAAVEVTRRAGPDATMIITPADHEISDAQALCAALATAATAAERHRCIVLLGIEPSRPETGYGYIEPGEPANNGLFGVARFVEKPDAETAVEYVASGLLWNSGLVVAQADVLLDAFARHLPRSAAALSAILADPRSLQVRWGDLDAISFDYGVLERESRLLILPCDPGWSDLGSWPVVAERWPEQPGGRGLAAGLFAVDAKDNAVYAPGKAVALLGVRGLIVVDAGDALLVLDRSRDQEIRAIVALLEAAGRQDLL